MFDDLYVIGKKQCVFSGPVSSLVPAMERAKISIPKYYNPADFVIELAGDGIFILTPQSSRAPSPTVTSLSRMRSTVNKELSSQNVYQCPLIKQFLILLKRQFKLIYRNAFVFHLRFVSHALVGLLFGGLYYKIGNEADKTFDNFAFIFISLLFLQFSAIMPSLLIFPIRK